MVEERIDGRRLISECAEILSGLGSGLPELAGKAGVEKIRAWRERIEIQIDDIVAIKSKLFLKTQEGTHLTEHALKKVKEFEKAVESVHGMSTGDAIRTVEMPMEEMTAAFFALSEKARAQVIRMT